MPTTTLSHHGANWSKKTCFGRSSASLLVAGLYLLTVVPAMADTHSQLPTTPCVIRLVFDSDVRGMPSVGYKLSLQIRNQTARDIAGVSVYWLDKTSAIIGNSAAVCGKKMGLSVRLRAGHAKRLSSKLAEPYYKGLERPHGPK